MTLMMLLMGGLAADALVSQSDDASAEDDTSGQEPIDETPDDLTIDGSNNADTLAGDTGADSLNGYNGDDNIMGGAGDDTLIGLGGADTLNGQFGDDSVSGGGADDLLWGGLGGDTLAGELGADKLLGGEGADSLSGGLGADSLWGGLGDDTLQGGLENDRLYGEAGADLAQGGMGSDTLEGGDGNDTLQGGNGKDALVASNGDDLLEGGAGDDFLYAGNGADTIIGGDGSDDYNNLTPGDVVDLSETVAARDELSIRVADFVSLSDGDWTTQSARAIGAPAVIRFDADQPVMADQIYLTTNVFGSDDMETTYALTKAGISVTFTNLVDDVPVRSTVQIAVFENAPDNLSDGLRTYNFTAHPIFTDDYGGVIEDTAGDDKLNGTTKNDSMIAGAGDDAVYGYWGEDTLVAGSGADTLWGGFGDDLLRAELGEATLAGGQGDDRLEAKFGGQLTGNEGNDSLLLEGTGSASGGQGNDFFLTTTNGIVHGGDGDDTIVGRDDSGAKVYGDAGADSIESTFILAENAGDIWLSGGAGADTLSATGLKDIYINGGDDSDDISVYGGASVRANQIIDVYGGAGDDNITIEDTFLGGDLRADAGSGADTISFEWNSFYELSGYHNTSYASAELLGGAGDDVFLVHGNGTNTDMVLDGGAGADRFVIGDTIERFDEINTPTGESAPTIRGLSAQDQVVFERPDDLAATLRIETLPDGRVDVYYDSTDAAGTVTSTLYVHLIDPVAGYETALPATLS